MGLIPRLLILCLCIGPLIKTVFTLSHSPKQYELNFDSGAVTAAITDITLPWPTLAICQSIGHRLSLPSMKPDCNHITIITTLALLLSGDIQLNPGHNSTFYPCGYCELRVGWSVAAVCCDGCDIWYHKSCLSLATIDFEELSKDNMIWLCCKCDSQNLLSNVYHSFELSNSFEPLSHLSSNISLLSPTAENFHPPSYSSPCRTPGTQGNNSRKPGPSPDPATSGGSLSHKDYGLPPRQNNLRTLVVNCNSIQGKCSEFKTVVQYTQPDIIIGSESKLGPEVLDSEVFPEGYVPYRKDRKSGGGGVFIAVKNCYPSSRIDTNSWEGNSEQVWVRISLKSSKDLFIGSFYRPPNKLTSPFTELGDILSQAFQTRDKTIILGGDFNARGINWDSQTLMSTCDHPGMCDELIQLSNDTGLLQMQREPTREQSVLDLYFTNKPGLIKSHHTIPGISDHHMVVVDSDMKPIINKKKPRKVFRFSKADWEKAKQDTMEFSDSFQRESSTRTVQENWTIFKSHLENIINKYVPSKTVSGKPTLNWVTLQLKRLTRKKKKVPTATLR